MNPNAPRKRTATACRRRQCALFQSRRRERGQAFTLIEVAVCLLIFGLLTGTAALSLRGLQRNVDIDAWVERAVQLDHQTRRRAEQQGRPWRVVVDLTQQSLWAEPVEELIDFRGAQLRVPRGWTLRETYTSGDQAAVTASTTATTRQVVLLCSTQGVMPTYALRLSNEHKQHRGLLIVGGSGQQIELQDEQTIENLFAALR
ncbi:MAG: prepilin-type N-terminal cleavage/methylation domain-containing protein [Planctomycetota bacterium]